METGETFVNKPSTDAPTPAATVDSEMVDVAPSSVVTTEDRPDNIALRVSRDQAQAWITFQVSANAFFGIRVAQPHTLGLGP